MSPKTQDQWAPCPNVRNFSHWFLTILLLPSNPG